MSFFLIIVAFLFSSFIRLTDLLFEMQQYGQPPEEIMKDLAPGLKFDEEGMPIMPNVGGPGMPSTSYFPSYFQFSPNHFFNLCLKFFFVFFP